MPGAFLLTNRTAWRTLSRWVRCIPGASRVGQGIATSWGLCGAPPCDNKQGATLLAQLAGNHAKSAATPLVRLMPPGCCFFPLRKCIFSVAATFWVAKLDFLCCWFFSCLGRFFSCLGRVFSCLGRFFPAASKMHFFCCKGALVLLQGVFSAALNFSHCEAAFFAGVFSRCGNSFFPLQGVFFLLPNVFFSVPMFFSCCEPVFFARCAKTRS